MLTSFDEIAPVNVDRNDPASGLFKSETVYKLIGKDSSCRQTEQSHRLATTLWTASPRSELYLSMISLQDVALIIYICAVPLVALRNTLIRRRLQEVLKQRLNSEAAYAPTMVRDG
jgi:hypothetical protein